MKILLIPALNINYYLEQSLGPFPQVGIINLFSAAKYYNFDIEIVDLNRISKKFDRNFLKAAIRAIEQKKPDIIGFSCVSDSYHFTIALSEKLKTRNPNSLIVFGGPQASCAAEETLKNCSFVDIVFRGEAEKSFIAFLNAVKNGTPLDEVKGILFRKGEEIICTKAPDLIKDLDELPIPDLGSYRDALKRHPFPLDIARGCPFRCSFCSTSVFWENKSRHKSIPRIIREIAILKSKYHVKKFTISHDNFTVNSSFVRSFCRALINSKLNIKWSCMTRGDCLTKELLLLMRQSGCVTISFGVETASSRLQKKIKKNLDLHKTEAIIKECVSHGIHPIIFLIYGLPEEKVVDKNLTLKFIKEIAALEGCFVKVSRLEILKGSELYRKYAHKLVFEEKYIADELFSLYKKRYRDCIKKYPALFSCFYYLKEKRNLTFSYIFYFMCCKYCAVTIHYLIKRHYKNHYNRFFEDFIQWQEKMKSAGKRFEFARCFEAPRKYFYLLRCFIRSLAMNKELKEKLLDTYRRERATLQ